MSTVDVYNKISVYEIDDKEVGPGQNPELTIESHWNIEDFVVLGFMGKKLTVAADALTTAIKNATNTG
mgnify:FL=1